MGERLSPLQFGCCVFIHICLLRFQSIVCEVSPGGNEEVPSLPCLLNNDGTINSDVLGGVSKSNKDLLAAIHLTPKCASFPDNVCSSKTEMAVGSRFCVLQNVNRCVCQTPNPSNPSPADLVELAINANCPVEIQSVLSRGNACLGDQLCSNITATKAVDPILAAQLLVKLSPYRHIMKCSLKSPNRGPIGNHHGNVGRKKRAVTDVPTVTCAVIQNATISSFSPASLANLSLEVLTRCPNLLMARNFTMDQLIALVNIFLRVYGSPCSWNATVIQQAGPITFGLPPSNFTCMNFTDPGTMAALGQGYQHPPNDTKMDTVYSLWKSQSKKTAFNGDDVNAIAGMSCSMPAADFGTSFTAAEFMKAIKVFAGSNCYKPEVMPLLANLAIGPYALGDPAKWTPSTLTTLGAVIAGMPLPFFANLTADMIVAISPLAISRIPPEVFTGWTSNQTNALTLYQAMAITDRQFTAISPEKQNIINGKRNAVPPPSSVTGVSGSGGGVGGTRAVYTGTMPPGQTGNVPTRTMPPGQTMPPMQSGMPPQPSDMPPGGGGAQFGNFSGPMPPFDPSALPPNGSGMLPNGSGIPPYPSGMPPYPSGMPPYPSGMPPLPTQPPFNRLDGTVPPKIDSSNIGQFVDKIGQKLSTDDINKIDPNALNSPGVLQQLNSNNMSSSQQKAVQDKINDMLKQQKFNPDLYASAGSLVGDQAVKNLTNQQAFDVVSNPNFKPDPATMSRYGPKVGDLLGSSANQQQLQDQISNCSKVMPGVPPQAFVNAIKKATVDDTFLHSFKDATLTEKQSRDLYNKYVNDSKLDSKTLANNIDNLPQCVRQAITASDVKSGVTDVLSVLIKISDSSDTTKVVDPAASPGFTPSEQTLYDQVKRNGASKLTTQDILDLLRQGLMTVDFVKQIGTPICSLANNRNNDVRADPTVLSAIYDLCKPTLGSFCSGTTDQYGPHLSTVAPPADISAITDDTALFSYCVPDMCVHGWQGTVQQLNALLKVVTKHLDTNNDLSTQYNKIQCLLPYLGKKYLSKVTDGSQVQAICSSMACQHGCEIVPTSVIQDALDFCVRGNVSIRSLTCPGSDRSCLLNSMNSTYFSAAFNCDQVTANIDVLQSSVIDCDTRKAIYVCVKDRKSLKDANTVAQYGTLLDQLADADWTPIPQNLLCGLVPLFRKVYSSWANYAGMRAQQGLTSPKICANQGAVLKHLVAADASSACGATPPTRKKRDTSALTCNQILQMGNSVIAIDSTLLSTLSDTEFLNCINFLGRVNGFTSDQWQALANIAQRGTVFDTDTSKWSTEQIISAAGIVTGLTSAEIGALKLTTLEAIHAIGTNGLWTADLLSAAFQSAKTNYASDLTKMTSAEINSFGNVLCGASTTDLSNIPPATLCGGLQVVGQLDFFQTNQLQTLATSVKDNSCLGPDVTKWNASDVGAIGVIIGGLSKDDLSKLNQQQIQRIPNYAIPAIPAMQFNGFTTQQLGWFSANQAAQVTSAQYQSLDPSKQFVIQNILSTVKSDLNLDPSLGSNQKSACSAFAASMLPIATVVLTYLLRI